ncbi:MAG: 4Fe-4S binding protein [Chitinivibrionales bacterium]|nr:4Fe-4S binding protein [Chitinivibrionales bacterium]
MITKKVLLFLPSTRIDKPIIYDLVKKFDLIVNIFRAKITPQEQGYLALDLTGYAENIEQSLLYLRNCNIEVDEKNKGVHWDSQRCTHCGICVTQCPTKALYIDNRLDMKVVFDSDRCIECLNCIDTCPFSACSSIFSLEK